MSDLVTIVDRLGRTIGQDRMVTAMADHAVRLIVRVVLKNDAGRYLMQQRVSDIMTFPDHWDVAAAGHVDVDETPLQAAHRELHEELRLEVELEPAADYYIESHDRGRLLRQYTHVFYGRFGQPAEDVVFEPAEVQDVRWVALSQIDTLGQVMPEARRAFVAVEDYLHRRR